MAGTGSSKAVDPIAYRPEEQGNIADSKVTETTQNWTFDPRKLENADVNISAYGDDSSEKNYNNPELWGGENEKYKGENTKNTSVAYNPDATLEGLNPNYAYGQKAQMVNSGEAGYIQRRNDEIASALYNAGKVSPEDVRAYLEQQEGFMNSTANERENTIKSVWKRLGEISSSQSKNENKTDGNAEGDNNALKNMENDLNKDRSGTLYGKNTADINGEDKAIKTLADANSVEARINQSRINNFKSLQAMDSTAIAASIVGGYTPYGDQGMRDLMQYDPQKYAEVQQKVKEYKAQENINSITNGGDIKTDVDIAQENIKNEKERQAETYASSETEVAELLNSVDSDLASNQSANTAEGTMDSIQADIEKLKTRLKNLDNEASKVFKGDVPQYIVNAYKANRTKEIQDKLSELENRYNSAYDRYKTELDNTWKEREYNLQLRKFQQEIDEFEWKKQTSAMDNYTISWQDGVPYQIEKTSTGLRVRQLSTAEGVRDIVDLQANKQQAVDTLKNVFSKATSLEEIGYIAGQLQEGIPAGECGFLGNNLSAAMGSDVKFGNKLSEKINPQGHYTKSSTPVVGSFAIFNSKKFPENGHVGMVTSINEDGSYTVVASNTGGDHKLFYADYKPGSALTFIVPTVKFESDNNNYYENGTMADIEVPNSIYELSNRSVDPNSEEGKRLREEYIKNNQPEIPVSNGGELVPDADGKNTAAYKIIAADDGTPIVYRQRIYNLVPATLKNSDTELKNLYSIAKSLYEAGYSADEAAMVFYGLDPRNDKKGLLKPLISKARGAGVRLDENYYGNLGGLLSNGQYSEAVRATENSILPEEYKNDERDTYATITMINDFLNFLDAANSATDKNGKPLFKGGVYSSTLQDLSTKYNPNDESDVYARLAADLGSITSDYKVKLMGTTQTGGETGSFEGIIPDIKKDKISTIKSKLNSMKGKYIQKLNGGRYAYGLPGLDEDSLLDMNQRILLYADDYGDLGGLNI